ncbi:MAG: TIGR02221 family CRISPR-associated protein [Dolichospermum sp. DEX189]|jgi:CRISPR-associated DxTHG motif protein|uniref:TIGR02221 family CRISPR-associated protein n=1 Tax=Aphanizomenon flos-aquae FACHB-1040 TaxID=2692887 RepID=A0ABR8BWT3_APHFL|nr:TIGR02221 family CRISPR-associated protein [Aphanizomenon flos-aquae]MBD2279399.1 TIGR02221 family CRISPR-associated protein [Aphanizomenon flos-aquae FACHB-1040]MBO1072393.1 TIGR02221 family CRISPR-associated protein [Dolichospermum sp. DEX189]MDK2408871.1 TIGR02221 family CRISPR-associated protein [Aphanizomenon sp. 202]MDK2459819.1 TIGR02221 family CRISPR-associated protein [Aphanizomenon sp. PH219]
MSKINIITFLGDRGARQTTYIHNQKEYVGGVFAEALQQFCEYNTMLVCVTERARENTWPVLEALGDSRIKPIDIPTGRSTEEMWQTFKIIAEQVNENDHVIFDITHGLRSLPFLVFLFAAYLKAAKNVTIDAIYYGALELGNSETGIPAPVIDLSEFVSMIDWLTATDQFIKTGNGKSLANLLLNGNTELQELASGIDGISQGLQLLRPMDVLEKSAMLPELIAKAAPTVSQSELPFITLLSRVEKDYGKFGLNNPIDYTMSPQSCLLRQLEMVEWYIEKGQIVQALSIAREWIPSLLCFYFKLNPLDIKDRDEMEFLLKKGGKQKDDNDNIIYKSRYFDEWNTISKNRKKPVNKLWSGELNLTNLRNDVLHAGFRKDPKNAEDIIEKIKQILEELRNIAQVWELKDEA